MVLFFLSQKKISDKNDYIDMLFENRPTIYYFSENLEYKYIQDRDSYLFQNYYVVCVLQGRDSTIKFLKNKLLLI
ncbi:MAG: hypothetical protein ACOC2U_02900 [bacterium]